MLHETLAELKGHYDFNPKQLEILSALEKEGLRDSLVNYRYFSVGKAKDGQLILSFFILKNVNPYDNYFDQYIISLDKSFFSANNDHLCRLQIKGNGSDLSLELIDITPKTYINLGIGSFGLNNLQEFCDLIGYKKIFGGVSAVDFTDQNDPEHGLRLIHFYNKNGFIVKHKTGNSGQIISEIEWLNLPLFINKNDISDAAATNSDNFFYGILSLCKSNRLKVKIVPSIQTAEKTFNCFSDEGIAEFDEFLSKIRAIHQK